MLRLFLFLMGLAIGSFLNVLALRYRTGGHLFTADILSGRSHCPYCKKTLRWYELIPLISFLIQFGKCRDCHQNLTWQYPIVELFSGLVFAFLTPYLHPAPIWILVILTLIFITLVDARLSIIPDQLNLFLGLLAIGFIIYNNNQFSVLGNRLVGGLVGLVLTGLIIVLSNGRAMGWGDLKMAAALGFLFGWPEIILILGLAFIIGGFWGAVILLFGKKTLKDAIPFGPFLAIASFLVLLFGDYLIKYYLGII